ncbi:unannotated protein [freshwater metagenome]|uniref:Unannotated protein n=1 Tax=freshwater metagenome TaxID=449393 RepID=A0A6J7L762_9ZZZZ
MYVRSGRSAAVTTATTPGIRRAPSVSMLRIRPCGMGLRTMRANSMFGSTTSPEYTEAPVDFCGQSILGTRCPMGDTRVPSRSAVMRPPLGGLR